MLSRMAPSSPPEMRTLHLLKAPDILLANDNRQAVSYWLINTGRRRSGEKFQLICATNSHFLPTLPFEPVLKSLTYVF
jgi:hypothetical protein